MEGADLVESVATTHFPVDGDDATGFLSAWIAGLRCRPALQGVLLGGITIAGLGVVDIREMAERLRLPTLVVNRRDPAAHRLADALRAAGLADRLAQVERTPPAIPAGDHLFVAAAGVDPGTALGWVDASRGKSELPEPLRLAHLIARGVTTGESRGRP